MSEFKLDWQRAQRTGTHEALLCDPKSVAQIDAIVSHAVDVRQRLLLTRLGPRKFARLAPSIRQALDYEAASRTAVLGGLPPSRASGRVAIVAAGTSDSPVAREAARALAFAGEQPTLVIDVGVAGLWRLMERIDDIRAHRVVIAVAGMEGAIFSVIAGLVPCPVVAVPTSVGYGVGKGGRVALDCALASCASGLAVVNIDNGFGAAHVALRMLAQPG
jgi:NCAIR mutase (PurE)-related protein